MRLRLQTYEHTDCTDRTILVRRNRYAFAEQAGIGTPVVQNSTHDNLRLRLRRVVLFPLFSLRSFRPRIAQRMLHPYLSKLVDWRINIWYFLSAHDFLLGARCPELRQRVGSPCAS